MELKYLTQEVRTVRSAILNNISASGTSVAVYEPMAQGTAVWLEMKVTNGNGNGQSQSTAGQPGSMKAQGEVVWCRPAVEVSGMYEVGIHPELRPRKRPHQDRLHRPLQRRLSSPPSRPERRRPKFPPFSP